MTHFPNVTNLYLNISASKAGLRTVGQYAIAGIIQRRTISIRSISRGNHWSNSIYDLRCARVARAIFNVLDLNRGNAHVSKKTIDHCGYRLYSIWNFRRLPIGYFHHVIGDSPGASPVVNWVRPLTADFDQIICVWMNAWWLPDSMELVNGHALSDLISANI